RRDRRGRRRRRRRRIVGRTRESLRVSWRPHPTSAANERTTRRDRLGGGRALRYRLRPAPVAQLDRAPDFESGGQGFESLPARQQRSNQNCEELRRSDEGGSDSIETTEVLVCA